ncbi:MAG: molybdopterin-binding protein [Oscillospiraceae bacterium]|nr:molybdopterin-binding protein [Oscillospiraceae bacterium]
MKKLRVQDAIGESLCHDMTGILPDGKKGVVFKRGHVIRESDIPALLDIGKSHIFAWDPDADEVHEDDAAMICAEAVCGNGVSYDKTPSEGKVLMYSDIHGLFCVQRDLLRRINSVGDYTVACLPSYTDVEPGQKLGGIRIVPLVTKRENTESVQRICTDEPVFRVHPYKPLKCGVIITGSEVYYGRIEDKFEPIMRRKIEKYGGEIIGVVKCPDDLGDILKAISAFGAGGADLILLTGGMSVDPDDLTPTAIRESGAAIITQGIPMQPGNMLTIAEKDGMYMIGVPGASMHSPVTSLDVFLPRIFAGIDIPRDFAAFGEGGFCSGCEVCTYPRCYFGRGL